MDLAVWRDVSLMWLILLTFFAVAPFGVLFYFAIKGMIRLRQLTKQGLTIAQEKTGQAAELAEQASQKVAAPVIALEARAAQLDGMRNAGFRRK